ncbi:sulfotransferase [Candidatus Parcubacteria bacterium]|nr:MAG: sulfotransferase [Candidatus Parcubacteria bacterium]
MNKPNFFIIGAQKCGTTALCEYLRVHPNVSFANPKEPLFFADEFRSMCPVDGLDEYLRLFEPAKDKAVAIGEGSTGYLQSRQAIFNIYQFNPNARIIVMLRNPLELVCSLHKHLLYHGHEDEPSFERAWSLQSTRASGHHLPKDPRLHYCLQYANVMKLGTQLQRVMNVFPADQVMTIVFDDFVRDPGTVYRNVLAFLGLPDDQREDFPKVNAAKDVRFSPIVHGLRKILPWKVRERLRTKVGRKLFHLLLSKPADRLTYRTLPQPLIDEMKTIAEPEIELLARLLNRDLSGWMSWPSH